MRPVRQSIGGLGNLMFKQSYVIGKMLDGEIPDMYVQSYGYWYKHRDKIREYWGAGITPINKVALHIRRGDYLNASDFHTNLWETDYYKKAIKQFPGEKFLVFCMDRQDAAQDDADRQWCREHLPELLGNRFEMALIGEDETDDLNRMAGCKGIIGANSSFSWWAAFLGDEDKTVVMPKADTWFTDGLKRVELPMHWIEL